jgi:hypothetical protein
VVKDFSRKRSGDMEILKSRLRSGSREVIRKYSPSKPLVIPLINVISSSK